MTKKPLARLVCGVSLSLLAAGGRASGPVLEEVIVTAQKKSESLAEIPMTVNVITGEQFNNFANFDFRDIDRMTAGVNLTGENYDVDIAVRGLGTDLNAAIDPRVTVYWDGAYYSQTRGMFVSQFDLQRFELLRGPQGTLYGKASPAGAITVQTRDPNMTEMDGYLQQSLSQRDGRNTQAALSLPIIDEQLAVRVAGVFDHNRTLDVENTTLGIDNHGETLGGRFVALWRPLETLDARLSYNYVESDKDIDAPVEGNGISYQDREAVGEFASTSHERERKTVFQVNWELPNAWLLTSNTSHEQSLVERRADMDFANGVGQNQDVSSDVDKVISEELRLQSVDNEFWDWTVGLFYIDTHGRTPVYVDNYRVQGLPAPTYTPVVTEVTGPALTEAENWAVFTHNAFKLTERDTLTLGLRYNYVERFNRQTFQQDTFLLVGDSRIGPVRQSTIDGIPLDLQDGDEDAFTGTVKFQHQFTDELMAYASYDRGWRYGSVNISGQPIPPVWSAFKEETSDNFELGSKWQFNDGRGLLNLAAFYQIYSDFHYGAQNVSYVLEDGGIAQNSAVVNAKEVSVKGFETELNYLLTENWNVLASVSYSKVEFEDFDDAPCNDPDQPLVNPGDFAVCDLEGEPAGTQPEWSAVLMSEYTAQLGGNGLEWYLRGLAKAEDERWDPDVNTDLDSYAVFDVFAGVRTAEQGWDVSLWVKNLFDESARLNTMPTLPLPDYSLAGQVSVTEGPAVVDSGLTRIEDLLAPRTVGITARYDF